MMMIILAMKKSLLYGRRYDTHSMIISFTLASKPVFPILQMSKLRLREIKQFTRSQIVELGFS